MYDIDYRYVRKDGGQTWCYGEIEPDSNFSVTCDDEDDDGIVADIDTSIHNTWDKICRYLETNYSNEIEEIETC